MKTKNEFIDNLKKLKKDYIREKKELSRKYFELSHTTNEEYINNHSKYKKDDLVVVKSYDQIEFYKIVEVNTALNFYIDNEEYFDYFFIKEKINESNLFVYYLCQKLQKSGKLGKKYYNIYDSHDNHIRIGESKDYNTPSKIKNLFGMRFDHMFAETIK